MGRLHHRWNAPKPNWHTEVDDVRKLVFSCAINHATSELSPYPQFGQISAVDVALAATSNPVSLEALPDWAR